MTDLDKLIQLLQDFKIPFVRAFSTEYQTTTVVIGEQDPHPEEVCRYYDGDEDKISRYMGFYTCYYFDSNNKFQQMCIGE